MSDTYVPGFSHALQRYATGGAVNPGEDYASAMLPGRTSTKPGLAANLNELAARAAAGDFSGMSDVEARLASQLVEPTYSPEFQGYLNSVGDYIAGQAKPEIGQLYNTIQQTRTVGGPGSGIFAYNPESSLAKYAQLPVEQNVGYYATLYDPSKDSLLASGPAGSVKVGYNTPIALVNNRTGEIVAQGVGIQSAQDIVKQAKALSSTDGGKADWSVYTGDPGSTDTSTYKRVMYDTPNTTVGDIAKVVAPIALQFVPGLGTALGTSLGLSGTAATAVGTGLTAALGRTGAGIASGDSVLGSLGAGLKTGAITGLTAGALNGLGIDKALTSAVSKGASSAGGAAGGALGAGANEIVVTAIPKIISSALPATIGSAAIPGLLQAPKLPEMPSAPAVSAPETLGSPLEVIAKTGALSPAQIAAAGTLGAGALGAIATSPNAPVSQPSSGTQQQPTPQPTTQQPVNPNDIVVNANKPPNLDLGTIGTITGAAGLGGLITSPVTLPSTPAPQLPPAEKKGILDQIGELSTLDKIRLAGLGLGTIGDLFSGGGGSASPGTIPGGLNGGLNSVFTKTLPTANLPAAAPRTAQDIDYYRYGYGPQQSFFSNAPQGAANTSQAYTGYAEGGEVRDYDMEGALRAGIKPDEFGHMPDTYKLPNHMTFSEDSVYSTPEHRGGRWMEGADGHWVFWPSEHNMREHPMPEMQDYFERVEQGVPGRPDSYAVYPSDYRLPERKAQGGSPFAVGGPGDGRDDKIPAMLSDGEYVMDAETVSLLGNGSSKAGAKMLDKFRVNVRKQKGRKLAKGAFSDDAKAPEHYLKGRK